MVVGSMCFASIFSAGEIAHSTVVITQALKKDIKVILIQARRRIAVCESNECGLLVHLRFMETPDSPVSPLVGPTAWALPAGQLNRIVFVAFLQLEDRFQFSSAGVFVWLPGVEGICACH